MSMDRQTVRLITTAMGFLERLAIATEKLAEMAEQDPLRAVDRLLAMGTDPSDPAGTLQTMEERSHLLEEATLHTMATMADGYDKASGRLQDGSGAPEGSDPVSGAMRDLHSLTERDLHEMSTEELEAYALRMVEAPATRPTPDQVAAARARAAQRAGVTNARPLRRNEEEDDIDELPASEQWRLR
jgi:hypothetical protein